MTLLKQNKNFILNNPDKFIIDKRGDFINLEKDYGSSDYIIWKNQTEDYEEVRDKVVKEIFKDKKKWELVGNIDKEIIINVTRKNNNREIIRELVEEILSEKENWEIVYETRPHWWYGTVNVKPISYKHLPTGKEVSSEIFFYNENYILSGELGYREGEWKDYEQKRNRKLWEWRGDRNRKKQRERRNSTNTTSQPELPQTQNQISTPEPTNPETEQENQGNQNSSSTSPIRDEQINNEVPPLQQDQQEAQETAQKEEERLKKEQQEKEKKDKEAQAQKEAEEKARQEKEAKKKALENQKTNSIIKITAALNQELELKNSDLSSKYQNWENKINGLTEIDQVIDLESKVLTDIQARRKDKKTEQEVKENLNQFQNPESTPQQKEEALNNLEKNEGEQAYEEQKEEVNQAKREQATQNPTEYSQNAANKITKKMQEEGINEADLKDNQTKTLIASLKNGQIKDPTKIVETENQIRQKVWQTKVEKEIQILTQKVNQVLQTGKVKKEDITKIKQKLIEFLAKSNVYYSVQHQQAQALLTKLENYSNSNQNNNNTTSTPSSIPWKIIVPVLVVGLIILIAVIAMKRRKLKK